MHMHRGWILGALLAFLSSAQEGRADLLPSPLSELRAAAEALADVEPDALPVPRRESVPAALPRETAAAAKAESLTSAANLGLPQSPLRPSLKDAIRSAVHEEVGREFVERPSIVKGIERGKGTPKPADSAENGRSEAGQSRAAALQSQQARQNQAVSQANKEPKGQSGKLVTPPVMVPPSRGQALR